MENLLISKDPSQEFGIALQERIDRLVKVKGLNSTQFFHRRNGENLANQFSTIILETDLLEEPELKEIGKLIPKSGCKLIVITKRTDAKHLFPKADIVTTRKACLKLL